MAKKKNNSLNLVKLLKILVIVASIICIFTSIDFIVHSLSEEYSVPGYYFINKIIYGTAWAFFIFLVLRKWKISLSWKTLIFSGLIAMILQARYFYEGYPLEFVIEFLFFHFIMLWPISYLVLKRVAREI